MPTRIKICGITQADDAQAAVHAGADAIGLVFAPKSPRRVSLEQAINIAASLPPFVTTVALFVNAARAEVEEVIHALKPGCLQFHGEESPAYCASFAWPWLKAVRVKAGVDLLQCAALYAGAQGMLLDAYSPHAHGGTGECFDWGLIPPQFPIPVVLAGGLQPENVGAAIRQVRPWAVDVSSGVESAPGVKDVTKIAAFIKEVTNVDLQLSR